MRKAAVFFIACVGLLGCLLLLPRYSAAAWPDDPLLNVPLCNASAVQEYPVSVSDGAGGAIVAWTDYRNSVYGDIYARRISSDGTVMWTANGVLLCNAAGVQRYSTIVSDGVGGAIVTWEDQRNTGDIYAQRISPDGVVRWAANGVAVCAAASMQVLPMITSDGEGGAIVAWADYRTGGVLDIYAQRVDSSGAIRWTTDGVTVCAAANEQDYQAIVSDSAGGAIVAWRDHRSGSDYNLYAQRISAVGAVQWTPDGVAICTATGLQTSLRMTTNGRSGAIMAWLDVRSGTGDVYAQQVSDDGAVLWGNGVPVCTAYDLQSAPSLILDGVRGAIITWQDGRTSYDYPDIYAQRVDSLGASKWTADGVALCTASGGQGLPTIIRDGAGGTIVVWTDYRGASQDIYAQRLEADGNIRWDLNGVAICALSGHQSNPAVVADGGGGAIIAWQDERNGSDNDDIYAQRVWADGSTPVLLSLVSADIGTDGVRLTWLAGGSGSGVATVYRSPVGGEWTRIGEVTADGTGYLRYTDPIDPTASRMGYRLGILDAGIEGFYGETWVDLPGREGNASFALEPVRPNPAQGGALTVSFSLSGAAAASLELLDVAGRRIAAREVGSLGAGRHTLGFGNGQHLAPGLYLVRLQQGASTRVTRAAVLE